MRAHRAAADDGPSFGDVLEKKRRSDEEREAGAGMVAAQASSGPPPQAETSSSEATDASPTSEKAAVAATGPATTATTDGAAAASADEQAAAPDGQTARTAQPGAVIDALNAQPALAEDVQAGQVSFDPAGVVDLAQQNLTEGIENQDPAAQRVAFAEGETPDGQKQGVILDGDENPAAEAIQKAASTPAPATSPASAESVQAARYGQPSVEKASEGLPEGTVAQEAQAEKVVEPVDKSTTAQETVLSAVEANRGTVQTTEVQSKTGLSQTALAQQVSAGMELMIQQGRSSMRIQLSPQELGGINIHLISSTQGVTVTVTAEQAGTTQMLQTQVDQLRQALSDAGVQVANLNVGQQQLSGQFSQGHETFAQAQQNRYRRPHEASLEEPLQVLGARSLGSSSVDYRV